MAPVIVDDGQFRPIRRRPRLVLDCTDLAHPGSRTFFDHAARPDQLLQGAVDAVLDALYGDVARTGNPSPSPIPPIRCIFLKLHDFGGVAYTCSSDLDPLHKEMHLSLQYLAGVAERSHSKPEHVALEIRGVVTHEMVHVFQHNGAGTVPGGVVEGVADWVREKAGVGAPHWKRERPGDDDRWDQGYEKTGFFLDWLSKRVQRPDLVPALNLAMQDQTWDDGAVLRDLLGGQQVGDLFREYRRSFDTGAGGGSNPAAPVPTHGPRS
ncbi:hypothetical protein JCM8202_003383 [Rhodotorula sphaerocarpa]